MRIESITAIVTRFFVVNEVREIRSAVSTVVAFALHSWLGRMLLGMSCCTGTRALTSTSTLSLSELSLNDLMWNASKRGLKPGNPLGQMQLAVAADYPAHAADYPAGIGRG
ncbi:hypothetical protein [Novipirellula caenicola]|uniref:Uncharacterized protein n=1 Tax=Novipirellula caenicola TaxID=1536901 RepID=A0ABP9VZQ9_9BACT